MVDIVITWVNGDDIKWKESFEKYSFNSEGDKRVVRYRDWELLKYWFRSVEKFAPWVRKIHFITEGHLPPWINKNAEKLNIVRHSDYISEDNLPLFCSRAIEVNINKISELSEKFIYFNDDFFILDKLNVDCFFKNDLPCDIAVLNAIDGDGVSDAIIENLKIINRYFKKRQVIAKNLNKWFNLKYGFKILRTFLLLPWPNFTGFYDSHLPTPYLKSTFDQIWNLEPCILTHTLKSKFRKPGTVNPYLFRYWQLVSGNFMPHNPTYYSKYFEIVDENIDEIVDVIINQKKKIIVLNDSSNIKDFNKCKNKLKSAFEIILPIKSQFEI